MWCGPAALVLMLLLVVTTAVKARLPPQGGTLVFVTSNIGSIEQNGNDVEDEWRYYHFHFFLDGLESSRRSRRCQPGGKESEPPRYRPTQKTREQFGYTQITK